MPLPNLKKNEKWEKEKKEDEEIEEKAHEIRPEESPGYILLQMGKEFTGRIIKIYTDDIYLFTATIGRKGEIKVGKSTDMGKALKNIMKKGGNLHAVEN